jgi:hypothetical protein
MNKMTLPGFTAEVSLYKTNRQYNVAPNRSALSLSSSKVYPQQGCNEVSMSECIPILTACAYGWCWWSKFWGRQTCMDCMNVCIDAHPLPGSRYYSMCKTCAISWPCG